MAASATRPCTESQLLQLAYQRHCVSLGRVAVVPNLGYTLKAMEQPLPLSNLKCAACGAGVSVAPGSATAVCAFCGNHQLVHPSIPVAHQVGQIGNSVGNVDRSTARLAAEMALPRLYAERQQCQAYYNQLFGRRHSTITQWDAMILIGTIVLSGILMLVFMLVHPLLGVLVLLAGMGAGFYLLSRVKQHYRRVGTPVDPEMKAVLAHMQALDARIAENYRTANS